MRHKKPSSGRPLRRSWSTARRRKRAAAAANAGRTIVVGMVALVVVAPELVALVIAVIALGVMEEEARLGLVVARDAVRAAAQEEATEEAVGAALAEDGTAPGAASTDTSLRPLPARLRAPATITVALQWCRTRGVASA